jgi:hypothetical protein
MAKRKTAIGFETVRAIGLGLPDVKESTSWGSPSLKVRDRMFACIPIHRTSEPDSLVLRLSFEDRDALLADAPDTYYLPEHYVDYPCVLVRLTRIHKDALADLIKASWKFETQFRASRPPAKAKGRRVAPTRPPKLEERRWKRR